MTGTISALTTPPIERASDAVPRCQPISAMIGFKNTPKVKASTGPLQTNKPVTEPPTTHHGLLNLMPKLSSHDAAGLPTRVGGHPTPPCPSGPIARMLLVAGRRAYPLPHRRANRVGGRHRSGSRAKKRSPP